jgi:SAM-dependent methyltransferase
MMPENLTNKRKKEEINWGSLRKVRPVSTMFGYDRGTPVDRYYIEKFLNEHKADIRGSVLEIKNCTYTMRFGGGRVKCPDILDIDSSNKSATVIADLRDSNALPKNRYDCVILTQTLHLIDNHDLAIKNLHGLLKNNGVLLCTMPSVSRMGGLEVDSDFWRFTKPSAQYIFKKYFAENKLQIQAYGNVLVDICFLEGISAEEISSTELDYYDKYFPLIVCVRAVK